MSKLYRKKEWLIDQYTNQEKTLRQIESETGYNNETIRYWLKKYNIPRRKEGFQKGYIPWIKGRKLNEKERKKISDGHKGLIPWNKGKKCPQLTGENHWSWKGGKYREWNGYINIYKPDHPRANGAYIKEHWWVMEQKIGRYLKKEEIIHHINGIKNDNKIENLYLCKNNIKHQKIEQQLKKIAIKLYSSKKYGKILFDHNIGEYYILFFK